MNPSALITFIIVMVIVGLAVYLIETYIPMAAPFKLIIRVVVILFLVLYLLSMLGIYRLGAQEDPYAWKNHDGQPGISVWECETHESGGVSHRLHHQFVHHTG